MMLRYSKILLVAAVALFLTLIAFGNITDYGTNFAFVQHVMSMDTTFRSPGVMWRAVTEPTLHHIAFVLIIAVEIGAAVLCWWGAGRLWERRDDPAPVFNRGKDIAVAGLTLALLLWLTGFMTIAGEWFAMWQSDTWNGQDSASRFLTFTGLILVYLVVPDRDPDLDV